MWLFYIVARELVQNVKKLVMGAHRKVFAWLGFYLLVSTIPVLAQRRSGDSGDQSRPDGGSQSGAREINIATFFNCTTGQESLRVLQERCDVFAYAAAELAREVINDEVNNNNNTRPEVNFYPVQLKSSVHSSQVCGVVTDCTVLQLAAFGITEFMHFPPLGHKPNFLHVRPTCRN